MRLWTPEDMVEEYWREWGVLRVLFVVVRLEKVLEAAIEVFVVRGLRLAASSDDVGLTRLLLLLLRAAELARRVLRLKIVRADMAGM